MMFKQLVRFAAVLPGFLLGVLWLVATPGR